MSRSKSSPIANATFSIILFADGASSGNPGPGGWGAVLVTPGGEVYEMGGRDADTTNNRMELTAVIRGLQRANEFGEPDASLPISIYTDSVYVIRGATQWSWGWRKKGWKTAEGEDVANTDLWKNLIATLARKSALGGGVSWHYVRGHSGIPGNERVDEIAVSYTKGRPQKLYRGPLLSYSVPIHDIPENTELPEMKPKAPPKPAAHSYLSVVGGTPMRHTTWSECERRVKGQSGAKFKKALSAEDEVRILASWGYKPEDL